LILNISVFRSMSSEFLLFINYPVGGILWDQHKWTKTATSKKLVNFSIYKMGMTRHSARHNSALGKLRQKDHALEASLDYILSSILA
jgi:hypothetical protein